MIRGHGCVLRAKRLNRTGKLLLDMRLTHLADYAVVMMTAAARRDAGARLSASELAQETGVPLPTAQKLMQSLASAGLLIGHRGAGGGYTLARAVADRRAAASRRAAAVIITTA